MENQVSAFSDCSSTEVHKAEEQAGSVTWESLAELCEGQERQRSGAAESLPVWYGK